MPKQSGKTRTGRQGKQVIDWNTDEQKRKEKKPAGAMTPSLAGPRNGSHSAVTDYLCCDRWKSLKPRAKISNAVLQVIPPGIMTIAVKTD